MKKELLAVCLAVTSLCACGPSSPSDPTSDSGGSEQSTSIDLVLSETELDLDMYAEYDLSILNYAGEASWESSDLSIATVSSSGHVSCQGKVGEVTITATTAIGKGSCLIRARNRLKTPNISVESMNCFVNTVSEVKPMVRYDDVLYDLVDFTLVSGNPEILEVVEGKKLRGIAEGETTVSITGTWKGKELSEKNFAVSILQEKSLILEETHFDIYDVNENSPVKKNSIEVTGDYFEKGEKVEADLVVTLEENSYLSSTDNRVVVSSSYVNEEATTIHGSVSPKGIEGVSEEIEITLHSAFDEKELMGAVEVQPGAVINKEIASIGGRENVLKFEIVDDPANKNAANPVWAAWNSRAEFYETTTKNGVSQFDHLMEEGYTYLSFDLYYTGSKGILMGAYGTGANSYFYNDVQVNRDDILVVDSEGKATNILVSDTWVTVIMDIRTVVATSMQAGQKASTLYCAPCFVGDAIYFDHIRYHYDDAVVSSLERAYDREVRELIPDEDNPNKASTSNEFVVYSPNYVSFEADESGKHTYDSSAAKAMDREARSRIDPYSLLHGNAVAEGYVYFHFTYRLLSGTPILYVYDLAKEAFVKMPLSSGASISNSLVYLFADGRPINAIPSDKTIDVVVRIDGKSTSSLYLTSNVTTTFEIQDVAYYKDESFFDDLSYQDPIRLNVTDVDFAYVGDACDIKDSIDVYYGSSLIENYEISNVAIDSSIATIEGSTLHFQDEGVVNATFLVSYQGKSKQGTIAFHVYRPTYVSIAEEEITLHCGDSSYFEKSHDLVYMAIKERTPLSFDELDVTITGDSDCIEVVNGKVTGKSVGKATLTLSFVSEGNTYSDSVEVTVFDRYRTGAMTIVASDATNPATYTKEENPVGGVSDVYCYHSNKASWNNKLDVDATRHNDASASYKRIVNGHIAYVSFAIRLASGSSGRIACVAPSGSHVNLKLAAGADIAISTAPNENISFYQDGVEVTHLNADTWYRVVVDFSLFTQQYKSGYTCAEITNVLGSFYLADVRYYHEAIPTEDLAVSTQD